MDPRDEGGSINIPPMCEDAHYLANSEDHWRSTRIKRMLQDLDEVYEKTTISIAVKVWGTRCIGNKKAKHKGSAPEH